MANSEDVLERAKALQKRTRAGIYPADVWEARSIIDDLGGEVEKLRAELALRRDYADQVRTQDTTIRRLMSELETAESAVRRAMGDTT